MKVRILVTAMLVLWLAALLASVVSSAQPAPQMSEDDPVGQSAHFVTLAGGNRVFVVEGAASGGLEASSVVTGGIQLTVQDQDGHPEANARIEWHGPGDVYPEDQADTDALGRVAIPVSDGPWRLTVYSWEDALMTVRDVVAPSFVIIAPTDTVSVQVDAVLPSGAPLDDGEVSFEPFVGGGYLGVTDASGRRTVLLQPRTYAAVVVDWHRFLYLHRRTINIASPTNLVFDARQMPTASVVFHHPQIASMGLIPMPRPPCRNWGPTLMIPDGGRLTLTADTYEFGLGRFIPAGANEWDYHLVVPGEPGSIVAGSTTAVWAGPMLSATVSTPREVYAPGTAVAPRVIPSDPYGNLLNAVDFVGGGGRVLARLTVRNPVGAIVHDEQTRDYGWPASFRLANDAPNGVYTLEWSLDTGPWQGILRAQSTFRVEGQTLPTPTQAHTRTATPTQTSTATRTPTRGPTVTPAVTGPWHLWLPVIVRG